MRRFLLPACACCLMVAVLASHAENTNRRKGKSESDTNTDPMSVTPEREAAAMTFVNQHHPELSELLVYLKKNLPKEFDKATRELFRTSERLAKLKDRGDERRYEFELKLWQNRSRAQLLAARLRTRPDTQLEFELRALLEQQYDLRLSQLEHDRDRAAARLDKANEQIDQFKKSREQAIEKQLRLLADRSDKPTKTKPTTTKLPTGKTSNVFTRNFDY